MQRKERTISLAEPITDEIDRSIDLYGLEHGRDAKPNRSDVINLVLGLAFGHPPEGEDLELLEELVDAKIVERATDERGRVRVGTDLAALEDVLVVAAKRNDG